MEKKAGEIPLLWATPSPLPPGQPAQSERVLATTPGSAGAVTPAQLRGVLMSPLPTRGRPLLDLLAAGSRTFRAARPPGSAPVTSGGDTGPRRLPLPAGVLQRLAEHPWKRPL